MSGKIISQKKNQRLVVATELWNTKQGEGYKAVVRNPNGTFDGATNQTRLMRFPEAKVITKTITEPRKKFLGIF